MRSCLLLFGLAVLSLTIGLASSPIHAQDPKAQITDPQNAGPDFAVQGEYEGTAGKDRLGAQVVAKGNGKFSGAIFVGGLPGAGWDGKTKYKIDAKTTDGKTTLTATGKGPDGKSSVNWIGVLADGKLIGKTAEGQEFTLTRTVRQSPTLGLKPPPGAIVLFDGTPETAAKWSNGTLVEGNLLKMGTSSKDKFGDIKLHIEFRCPYQPFAGGQGRGNSGVYVNGQEVQVLDSFGLDSGPGDCGGLYGFRKPDINACLPPLTWQTYDIEFRLARKDGDNVIPAKITVVHNGIKIHDNVEFKKGPDKPGGINLQNHGNPVYYKNIWVVELK